jgi:hypothetical protein
MPRDHAWIKLQPRWYETWSHLELSGLALLLGPLLLVLARQSWDGESDTAEIPMGADKIASRARFPVAEIEAALAEIVEAGTLVKHGERWVFPNFGHYQINKSTKRSQVTVRLLNITPPEGAPRLRVTGPHLASIGALIDTGLSVTQIAEAVELYAEWLAGHPDQIQWWGAGMFKATRWEFVERGAAEIRAKRDKAKREAAEAAEAKARAEEKAATYATPEQVHAMAEATLKKIRERT